MAPGRARADATESDPETPTGCDDDSLGVPAIAPGLPATGPITRPGAVTLPLAWGRCMAPAASCAVAAPCCGGGPVTLPSPSESTSMRAASRDIVPHVRHNLLSVVRSFNPPFTAVAVPPMLCAAVLSG